MGRLEDGNGITGHTHFQDSFAPISLLDALLDTSWSLNTLN